MEPTSTPVTSRIPQPRGQPSSLFTVKPESTSRELENVQGNPILKLVTSESFQPASPNSFSFHNGFGSNVDLALPKYYSTPKSVTQEGQNFVRYNSHPSRWLNFSQNLDRKESVLAGACGTPCTHFTKVNDVTVTTPDSGFCTPALDDVRSISSSPVLPAGGTSYIHRCMSSTPIGSTPITAPAKSAMVTAPSLAASSLHDQNEDGFCLSLGPIVEDSEMDKSFDLQTLLNPLCNKVQASNAPNGWTSNKTMSVQSNHQQEASRSLPYQPMQVFQINPATSQPQQLPGVLSLRPLTPIPVIMAPSHSEMNSQLSLLNPLTLPTSTDNRKALEDLQTHTFSTSSAQPDDLRPNHSYMDLIKMALESVPDGQMTLKEIITWIEDHFSYFRLVAKPTWKNSIRHNLSLHHDFTKVEEKRHGGKWKLAADAKKYAHRIPKPPVVKPAPKLNPVPCVKKRSGPQPILPKTFPYALVPIALRPFGPDALKSSQLDRQPQPLPQLLYSDQQQHQQQLQTQQQDQHNHGCQTLPEPHCSHEPLQHGDRLQLHHPLQPQETNLNQQTHKQHIVLPPGVHRDHQPQAQPRPVSSGERPREVKLHFRLTQHQQRLLHMEQTRQNSSGSTAPEPAFSAQEGRTTQVYDDGQSGPPLSYPSGFQCNQIDLVDMNRQNKNRQPLAFKRNAMRLPLLAPKPSHDQVLNPLVAADLHTGRKGERIIPRPNKNQNVQESMTPNLSISNSQDHLGSISKMAKLRQVGSKNRSVCKILDRPHKSRSFDSGSRVKKPGRDLPKIAGTQGKSRVAPVLSLASMIKEDRRAAEEIERLLHLGEVNKPGSLHEGEPLKRVSASAVGSCGVLEKRDLNRPESEPGKDLAQQTWKGVMSPLVWDEDSRSSYVSSGVEEDSDCVMVVDAPGPAPAVRESKTFRSCQKENNFGSCMNTHSIVSASQNKTCYVQKASLTSKRYSHPLVGSCSTSAKFGTFTQVVPKCASTAGDLIFRGSAVTRTKSQDYVASEALRGSQEHSMVQHKPKFYRTKSRRKQVHVPLTTDLSPKRDKEDLVGAENSLAEKASTEDSNKDCSSLKALGAHILAGHIQSSNVLGGNNLQGESKLREVGKVSECELASEHAGLLSPYEQYLSLKNVPVPDDLLAMSDFISVSRVGTSTKSTPVTGNTHPSNIQHLHFNNMASLQTAALNTAEWPLLFKKSATSSFCPSMTMPSNTTSNMQESSNPPSLSNLLPADKAAVSSGANFPIETSKECPPTDVQFFPLCDTLTSPLQTSPNSGCIGASSFSSSARTSSQVASSTESRILYGLASSLNTDCGFGVDLAGGAQGFYSIPEPRAHTHPVPLTVQQTPPSGSTISDRLKHHFPSSGMGNSDGQNLDLVHNASKDYLIPFPQPEPSGPSSDNFSHLFQKGRKNYLEPSSRACSQGVVEAFDGSVFHESNGVSPPVGNLDAAASDSSFLDCSLFDNIDSLMHTSLTEPISPFKLKDSP